MNTTDLELNICHLYPDLMNMYGDRGNVIALRRRCEWRGIKVNVSNISIGDPFEGERYDLVFIGGGQDFEQEIIMEDFLGSKGNDIKTAVYNNKVILAICGGYQMLGNYYKLADGKELEFLGALDIWTIAGDKRLIGNMAFRCDFLGAENVIVGFENHSGRTYLGQDVKPLGKVVAGFGNNGEDGLEGAVYKNTFCSYSHGSLLPKNPALADFLIHAALSEKYRKDINLLKLEDTLENKCNKSVLSKVIGSR